MQIGLPCSALIPCKICVCKMHFPIQTDVQLWLVALYFMIARATPAMRIGIALTIVLITIVVYPPRLWQSQVRAVLFCPVQQ